MQTFADAKAAIQEAREFHRLVWNSGARRDAQYFGGLHIGLEGSFVDFCSAYTIDCKQYKALGLLHTDAVPLATETSAALDEMKKNLKQAQDNFDKVYGVAYAG